MKLFQMFGLSSSNPQKPKLTTSEEVGSPPALLGRIGLTTTKLRLTGFAMLDDLEIEVLSTKGFVPKGTQVKIVGQRLGQYLVEPFIG